MFKTTFFLKQSIYFLAFSSFFLLPGCTKQDQPRQEKKPEEQPKVWVVSTFAGSGQQGYLDGADSGAKFNFPTYLALDTAGHLFVSDLQNFLIRKISNGIVTTFSGHGVTNPDPAFGNIFGLVVDKQNHLYDIEYSLIRKFSSPTSATVFAGGMSISYKDGPDTSARFNVINRIVTDKNGNFYVPDFDMSSNFLIRKITPQGFVSTIPLQDNTGFGSGSSGNLFYTSAIAVDLSGNIYYTANGNCIIKKADPKGNVSVLAGAGGIGFTDGKGTSASFNQITALAIDTLNQLYVVDGGNHAIRKVTPDGDVSTISGRAGKGFKDGNADTAMFFFPFDIKVDKKGIIYVADAGNHRIRKLEFK